MDKILETLLEKVADLHGVPSGAYMSGECLH